MFPSFASSIQPRGVTVRGVMFFLLLGTVQNGNHCEALSTLSWCKPRPPFPTSHCKSKSPKSSRQSLEDALMTMTSSTTFYLLLQSTPWNVCIYLHPLYFPYHLPNPWSLVFLIVPTAIGVVCFGKETGLFRSDSNEVTADGRVIIDGITRIFEILQNTTYSFPSYRFYRSPVYQEFLQCYNSCKEEV